MTSRAGDSASRRGSVLGQSRAAAEQLVRDEPEKADQIIAMEDAARGEGRNGYRMVKRVVRPTGALFVRQFRADPAMLECYLAIPPAEPVYEGPVGGVPHFIDTQPSPPRRRHLPLVEPAPASEAA